MILFLAGKQTASFDCFSSGDYAVTDLLIKKYPTTRQQKSKAGQTAFQLAKKNGFNRIAYLIEHGVEPPEDIQDQEVKCAGSKYTWETLQHAAKTGEMQIIRDFCEEEYESLVDRLQVSAALIQIAEQVRQQEVLKALQAYHNKLRKALQSKPIDPADIVRLKEHHRKMLSSFLDGLSQIIADSRESLDPSDPKTYIKLFSNVSANVQERSGELARVANVKDIERLSNKDLESVHQKFAKISSELKKLGKEKRSLIDRINEYEEQLFKQRELSAVQRKQLFEMREDCKKQLVTYECSTVLCQRQEECVLNRRSAVDFIKKEPNMYLFYRTVENRLQALFNAALVGQGGYLSTLMKSKHGLASNEIENASTVTEIIRISQYQ